jgi:hypothetical protein
MEVYLVKCPGLILTAALLVTPLAIPAQSLDSLNSSSSNSSSSFSADDGAIRGGAATVTQHGPVFSGTSAGPLSRLSVGVGASTLGISPQLTTNINPHLNIRATGNLFNYSTNFTTNGIAATGKLNMQSVRTMVDIYPFHTGFRVSPGILFMNDNRLTATANVAAGTSFTLNDQTYYSANANTTTGATPIVGTGSLGLNTNRTAFAVTTGWGNTIPRNGHWAFPFEIGAAFVGKPSVNVNLGGWACYDQAQTLCTDISNKTNPIAIQIQDNLNAQVAKWTSDIEPLKTYPIVSFGVAYSFGIRR